MITPQTKHSELAKILGVSDLYFKREDLHPYGSHKGRSIPAMIDVKVSKGVTHFAISSSGNAALAAVRYIQERNNQKKNIAGDCLSLSIFIGEHMNQKKKKKLFGEIRDKNITVTESLRPLQSLFQSKRESLRQSTDPTALVGYRNFAKEIITNTPNISDVFVATSSGTTAQALAEYFAENKIGVAVHIVQPVENSPIARVFDTERRKSEILIADAIVDKVVHRKDALINALKKTDGSGWVVSNDEIKEALKLLAEKTKIKASPNGVLGFAGLLRAISKKRKFKGAVVCIITGQ
ncbi:MAG: PLP-dependent lyase/thiolase [Patescibacteria group bacterium]